MGFFKNLKEGFEKVRATEAERFKEDEKLTEAEKAQIPIDGTAYIEEAYDRSSAKSTAKLSKKYAAKTPATNKTPATKGRQEQQARGERE